MNVSEFKQLLQDPHLILSPNQTRELEAILEEYPYFQSARALYLKGLKNLESYKYNTALKIAAAHTADREVLFEYITSMEFEQDHIANSIIGRETTLSEKQTISEEVAPNPEVEVILGASDAEDQSLPQNLQQAEKILDPALFDRDTPEGKEGTEKPGSAEKSAEAELELGKPLSFTKTEKHSFSQWLQLTQQKPLQRKKEAAPHSPQKKKKFELLDKFLENNPKIVPKADLEAKVDISESINIDQNMLMTETLAKVYLEQRKFKKALQAYKILSLKYPEKSGFFADQINAVKKLQKEKD